MAIIKGAINFGSNFNIGAKGPIDARQRVETIADLTTVWTAEIPAYKGMVVSVLEDNSIYILKTDDATVLDNWKKIGDATGDITNLQGQITANKTAIDKINGDANTTGSFAKGDADTLAAAKADATTKVDAAKTDLLGDAAAEYNTLGKLEDKIQAEASRADAAEKANAAAAAAAKDAADKAQETADEKVKSVEGTNTVVATTTEHAVSVSLKTSDKGNVKFTQDTDGLSANVTIPEATVTAVKSGDKVLALDGTELTSTISLSVDTSTDGEGKKYIRLTGIDGADLGKIDTADFVKDGMLDSAELVTNPSGQTEGTYIKLTWNTASGKKDPMYINVTSLIDTYTAKPDGGLVLEDKVFSVDTTKIATVESVNGVTSRVSTLEGKVGSAAVEDGADATGLYKDIADNKAAIAAETTRAQGAEKANADAIDILNGADTVEGSVDKKIKDALEAGAVTLEVKNDDAYLGVTSATTEGKGTVYTLASKADEINKAIKAEADKVKVSVASAEGAYVTASVDEAGRVITLREKVQSVEDSSTSAKGLAEASDVKNYVDQKVSDKNVAAEGESGDTALVSASASGNTVTVAATQKLKDAVAKAESSVQSVNGKTGSTVTLTGADIATNQNVSGSANATVNAVLADIYSKIGVVKVSSHLKTITVDEETGRIIDVNCQETKAAQEAGHVALEHGEDGALYGVMYYSGDDIDA